MNYFANRYLSTRLPSPQNTQPQKHFQVVLHESCKSSFHHRVREQMNILFFESEKTNA